MMVPVTPTMMMSMTPPPAMVPVPMAPSVMVSVASTPAEMMSMASPSHMPVTTSVASVSAFGKNHRAFAVSNPK